MKKHIKLSYIVIYLIFSLTTTSFADSFKENSVITEEDKKVITDFLKILKDPAKSKVITDSIESKDSKPVVEIEEKPAIEVLTVEHIKSLDDEATSFFIFVYKKYQKLEIKEKLFSFFSDLVSDIKKVDYKYFLSLLLITSIFSALLLLIEYFYTKKIYGINNYTNDFLKYKKQKDALRSQVFLFFINIKYFLPIVIPSFLLIELIKINAYYINWGLIPESIINILIFFVILQVLLKFLSLIFYRINRKTLINLKKLLIYLLYFLYVCLCLYYIFLILENYALIKFILIILALFSLVFFIRFRLLFKKISAKIIKERLHDYKKFLIHSKRYSITLLYIAIYCYFISIIFLDQSITKSIVVRLFIVAIGLIFIYLVQSYISDFFIKKFANKVEKRSKEITEKAFNKKETMVINLTNFWRFFKVLYSIIFIFLYLMFLDNVLNTHYLVNLVDLVSDGFLNIISNIFISFCLLMIISFVFVLFIEKYLYKISLSEDITILRKFLTLYKILQKPYKILFSVILLISIVSLMGISLTTLLASTGILTLLVAFGMKDILQNFFNSIMFLLENSFALNDLIELNGSTGTVEEISLVYVKIRDTRGNLIMVPFKNIGNIINYTKDYSYALVDIGVAYGTDINKVFDALTYIGRELEKDEKVTDFILSSIEIGGIIALADSSVNIRCKIKTVAGKQFTVRTELYKKIYEHFNEEGIEIPFPQTVVTLRKED